MTNQSTSFFATSRLCVSPRISHAKTRRRKVLKHDIPKMRAAMERNGSPEPRFSTDETRAHFAVELPVHPELVGLVLRDEVHDGVHDMNAMDRRILKVLAEEPKSTPNLVIELGYSGRTRNVRESLARLENAKLISLTIPDNPRSKNQKRQLTEKGRQWLKENDGDV